MGSASELEYHLLLANEPKMLDESRYADLNRTVCELKKMLASFVLKLKADC